MDGFGGFGSPEGMAEAAVASGAMTEAEAYGSFDTPDGVDGGADQTFNFTQDKAIVPQIDKQKTFVNQLKSFLNLSPTFSVAKSLMSMVPENMRAPTYDVMSLPGYQGLAENLGYDPQLAQAFGAKSGVPYGYHGTYDEAMENVPVVGSGAHLGLATNIANIGGRNVHMGPGFMMDENNYPGYGVNPVTGEGFADPGDPYIRRRRGTEIAGMI